MMTIRRDEVRDLNRLIVEDRRDQAAERRRAEAARLAAIRDRGAVPEACGPDIPEAPARGAFRTFTPREIVVGSSGAAFNSGYCGPGETVPRKAMMLADVFDDMERRAYDRHVKAGGDVRPCTDCDGTGAVEGARCRPCRGEGDIVVRFVPPFSPGQVAMARLYRTLVERHSAGGVKLSSIEGRTGGGSTGGGFMDAHIAIGQQIAGIRRSIGDGCAMAVRRIRPSKRGPGGARNIPDRALVDAVCIEGLTLSDVLQRWGWNPKTAPSRDALRMALGAVLTRMQGYHLSRAERAALGDEIGD